MNRRIFSGLIFTLALLILRASAFAQAAAESALLNAGSSTATVKAGSALNSVLNQSSKDLAGHVQRQVLQPAPGQMSQMRARPVSVSPVKGAAVRADTAQVQSDVIASIQGAVTCCVANQMASTPENKTAAESVQTNCSGQDSVSEPVPPKYKSVITLSFPKR